MERNGKNRVVLTLVLNKDIVTVLIRGYFGWRQFKTIENKVKIFYFNLILQLSREKQKNNTGLQMKRACRHETQKDKKHNIQHSCPLA